MLKKKLKTLLILIIILFISSTFVYADNEVTATSEDTATPISEGEENANTTPTQISKDDIHSGDMYVFEDNVTIDKIVDGNLFIFGNNVTIKAQVGGDVFVMANKVTIEEIDSSTGTGGYVYYNVFALANEVNLNGVVYDLYALASKVTIGESGYVYRDLKVSAQTLNIYGAVGRNAFVNIENISFKPDNSEETGTIYGDFEYSAKNSIEFPEDAIQGEVKFNEIKLSSKETKEIAKEYISSLLSTLLFTAVIALFVYLLSSKAENKSENILKANTVPVILSGLGGVILTPIAFVILLITVLGVKLSFTLLGIYLLLLALSTSIFNITITDLLANKFSITKKSTQFLVLLGITVLVWALAQIPYLNFIVGFATTVLGFGIMLVKLFKKEKIESNTTIVNE